ncbi:radical SAM family heme chaperone HemW [Asticcacaulis sp. ZE23SCel15]|uniref:radical SAM family heme chaperone HemW n=1 Tax=Asticcacaulis sp. ZE23SCel15 TaxID=3059027 RepID=UPI00265E5E49|nr:radical SAM family heme chaperone HemW [Asticcacaulis sp. ZE23SCel15]WKL58502.1 radical SAM family heme chaperone HemW [Asticcacaulis sp. ZE23SCel15]
MTNTVALYVHWPYCSRICPYCDFNVTRDRGQTARQTALFEAILTDLKTHADILGPRRLVSIFFGGGTPSLMKTEWVAEIVATARALFPPDGDIEVSLEANPTDAEIARYEAFRGAGVNRLSLGVQSLNDQALKFLGRNHSAREALIGLETARAVFGRVSIDLIYALPDQTLSDWADELTLAAQLGIEHISPYQLSLEPGTAFGRAARRGTLKILPPDMGEAFYNKTQSVLEALGFEAYEVSNHAKGQAAQSAHNRAIWEGVDYIGIGPGAHGRLTLPTDGENGQPRPNKDAAHGRVTIDGVRHATVALSDLLTYTAQVQMTGTGVAREALTAEDADEEALMLGLRLRDGVDLERFKTLDIRARAMRLITDRFLNIENNRLSATPKGRVVLDRLIYELLS